VSKDAPDLFPSAPISWEARLSNVIDQMVRLAAQRRQATLALIALSAAFIAFVEWRSDANTSIGLLYVFPILAGSLVMDRLEISLFSVLCSGLRETFSQFPWERGYAGRLLFVWMAFEGIGLLLIELKNNKDLRLRNLRIIQRESDLRNQAEQQLRAVVETTPLGIMTIRGTGQIENCNLSAARLFGFEKPEHLKLESIRDYLPTLSEVLGPLAAGRSMRASMECRGRRKHGDEFFANVWFSTFRGPQGERLLAAVVWDDSESLQNREVAGWDSLISTTRVMIGSMMHELRNLSVEAREVYRRLELLEVNRDNEDLRLLGSVVRNMESIASARLESEVVHARAHMDLVELLNEIRILIGPTLREEGVHLTIDIPPELPLVQADHDGLTQVFLNLARNSVRALGQLEDKRIVISAVQRGAIVEVRFWNPGKPIERPELLFRPFAPGAQSAGLGLYVSQALVRSYGGDMTYQDSPDGCAFLMELFLAEKKMAKAGSKE